MSPSLRTITSLCYCEGGSSDIAYPNGAGGDQNYSVVQSARTDHTTHSSLRRAGLGAGCTLRSRVFSYLIVSRVDTGDAR